MMTAEELREKIADIKIIALDMDGTCLNEKSVMNEHTREAVQRANDLGYIVVPATGRGFEELLTETFPIKNIRYVISANGAILTEVKTGRQLRKKLIPCDIAEEIARNLPKENTCIYVHRDDDENSHVMACTNRAFYDKHFAQQKNWPKYDDVVHDGLENYIHREGQDVVKMGIWFTDMEEFEKSRNKIHSIFPTINCVQGAPSLLEFTHGDASKGQALEALTTILGLERSNVCAIGDNGNDLSMIQFARVGVAMGNAIESVKSRADYITGTNEEDGVADFLEKFMLG
jgi:hypothetical protein